MDCIYLFWSLDYCTPNFGLGGSRSVRVESGRIEAEMNNAVDVNLYSINGYRNCFYKYGYESKYCRIPISD